MHFFKLALPIFIVLISANALPSHYDGGKQAGTANLEKRAITSPEETNQDQPHLAKRNEAALNLAETSLKFYQWRSDMYNRRASRSSYRLEKSQSHLDDQLIKNGYGNMVANDMGGRGFPSRRGNPWAQMYGFQGGYGGNLGFPISRQQMAHRGGFYPPPNPYAMGYGMNGMSAGGFMPGMAPGMMPIQQMGTKY
ncbi:hypothetical protein BSLG_008649 [Batrachochytrium salamandrivorans]|nr:hypothetical protein BASA60_006831 [Batrachochytrium salamandrivorans]KAH9253778.1 hypothetical protein BASA81_008211 [Batrachochytrium salamandrivorans]KAH9273314.1 hypothetical protein BASA83_004313 [Batrachochytrium salamandrivorans]KAJ1332345.1 hypothetical protein BSLG_008649 [Batrachochytrium salamandrivorans]